MSLKKFKMAAGGHFEKQLKKRVCTGGIFWDFFLVIIGTQRTPNPQKPPYLHFFHRQSFVAWIIKNARFATKSGGGVYERRALSRGVTVVAFGQFNCIYYCSVSV